MVESVRNLKNLVDCPFVHLFTFVFARPAKKDGLRGYFGFVFSRRRLTSCRLLVLPHIEYFLDKFGVDPSGKLAVVFNPGNVAP